LTALRKKRDLFLASKIIINMGLSIHYNGKLKDRKKIYKLRKELVDISNEMGWKYTIIEKK